MALTDNGNGPGVVPVPTRSPMAFVGPVLAVVSFVAILISPVAFGIAIVITSIAVALDLAKLLDARMVGVPRAAVTIVAVVMPLAALRDLGTLVIAISVAIILTMFWGLSRISRPGLSDSLAGFALIIAIAGFGFAHGPLLARGEFRGGPSSATALVIITLLLTIANQVASTLFAAATVQIQRGRQSSGDLWGFLATLFIAIVASTIRVPPVNRLHFLVLGIAIGGACTAGRAIVTMLLSSPTDPEEIVNHQLTRNAFALQGLGIGAFALPTAYYIARWLFV